MNMHLARSVETSTELREIAAVAKQMISPRLSKPIITIVQDTLVGVNRLTRPTEFFTRREFMNLLVHSKQWDGIVPAPAKVDPIPRWSGQQVVSCLLPAIHIAMGNKMWGKADAMGKKNMGKEGNDQYVIIKNGQIEQGILDGDVFDNALINILYNDFSPEMTVDFIDGLQAVVAAYLQNAGFSVGLSDLIADEATMANIASASAEQKKQLESFQLQVHMGLFENSTGRSNQEEFEERVFTILNKMTEKAGVIGLTSLTDNNRMVSMIKCGSKGSNTNIAQMISLLGQQAIDGRRIGYGFQDRTLPHFKRFDDGAAARGYIENSFVKGLAPHEFFFHAMTGREGLIDTAVKSVTGDTRIVIIENGITKMVKIGDWIDALISSHPTSVEHFPDEADLEMLQLEVPASIPTVSKFGAVTWGAIAAVTRHDPGDQLYRVETLGGRSVIVTASKSLLVWSKISSTFEQKNTPDVRVGDQLPVTMSLIDPPITGETIDVSKYLSKKEYLYGTDFHRAKEATTMAMEGRERVPSGWWATNNGKEFTLPFKNKGLFIRSINRSNTDNILSGFVYPFSTNRDGGLIPELFPMTYENGIFIGLFLAEGNVDVASGYVAITNNAIEIRQFVHEWFENNRIRTNEETHINALGGTSTTVRGFSTVLAKLLDKLCGHGAAQKQVPAEAFTGSQRFIKGILNGYFSGDGYISQNSVESSSASEQLTEGITMLLSRIGIFAKTFKSQLTSNNIGTVLIQPSYRISIRAQWAYKFALEIALLDCAKTQKLEQLRPSTLHRNFPTQSDCVLDEIVSIELISPDLYPKMYDLTVPETFTFGLANGLQVYDTADSGYLQRQLVKAMEDLTAYYDGSIRDTGGLIVQFAYGDDAMSSTKIENQSIGIAKMSDEEIRTQFSVDDARSQAFVAAVLEDRDMLIRNVWNRKIDNKSVKSAVHLERLINTAIVQHELVPTTANLVTDSHVLDTLEKILARTNPANRLWAALLRFNLNPKFIRAKGFTRGAFDWLAEQIMVKHLKSWVTPGEMSGILAAQSIGEPSTQMCQPKHSIILLRKITGAKNSEKEDLYMGPVGSFVDTLMARKQADVWTTPHGEDSQVLDMSADEQWAILGVGNDEKASWRPISQVSRHPANGGLVKVTTKSGRTTTATLTHSFLRRTTNGIAEVKGADLCVGQRIPVATRQPESPDALTVYRGIPMDYEFGWIVGIYLADGSLSASTVSICKIAPVVEERIRAFAATFEWPVSVRHYKGAFGPSKNTTITSKHLRDVLLDLCKTGSFDKCLSAPIVHANKRFIAGLLSGYFDGDGNVNAARQQIRASSRSEKLIRDVARLLPVCGIFGTICEERSVRIPGAVQYTLNILRKHAGRFETEIGLHLPEKAAALRQIVQYEECGEHHARDDIDMIPELGDVIAETGRLLKMPGQSRTYGRFAKKEAIGRRTLEKYIAEFEAVRVPEEAAATVATNLAILRSAVESDVIWDEITALERLDDPHELVYDFTVPGNDSFMVDDSIFVHNTLNSVDWDTEILIAKDGQIVAPRIGEFIDDYIETCDPERVQRLPNDQLYVALDDGHDWKAVSCDEKGRVQWTKLEAITKHPVVNEDGTNTILEVTLKSGRTVKATKGLSFLRFSHEKKEFEVTRGSDLEIGDKLPVANTLATDDLPAMNTVDLRTVLSPKEWLFGTEVTRAIAALRDADAAGNRHWFSHANGHAFTVPYARSDSFRDAFIHGGNMHATNIRAGFVYPKKLWNKISQIPDQIPLTREFGFFCGAFVSEGSCSTTQIQITNNEDAFLAPIRTLLDTWEIGHHTVSGTREIQKTGIKGHTQTLVIHSTLLTAVMKSMFGKISYEKTLPDWVLQAPDAFIKGLVDGYVSGDGHVAKAGGVVVSSVSEPLMIRFAAIMSRFGIFGSHRSSVPPIGKFDSVSRHYTFRITNSSARTFGKHFTLTLPQKQSTLETFRSQVARACSWKTLNDVTLDPIVTITECAPKGGKVYDLTVAETRNFMSLNCVVHRDTFHLAGVAGKSGMTRGVPRLKELFKVTQNPKATGLTIFMRPDIRNSKEDARRLAQTLEFTLLRDVVTTCRIYYDPRDSETLIAEDQEWLSFFAEFERDTSDEQPTSPWILRMELDREKMFNKNITMEEISAVIRAAYPMDVPLSYTDHNASTMVLRIRMLATNDAQSNALDQLTEIKSLQTKLLQQTLIRGLPGLRSVSFRKLSKETEDEICELDPETGTYKPVDQFVLETYGTNFIDAAIHPDVDGLRLTSNHIHDIYDNLGIEAACRMLYREIMTLFEQASAQVNYRHVSLLCDAMCNRGRMMPVDRYGVNKKKTGPLAKASFEQTEVLMLNAAMYGELDPITGVSANIMTGQPIRGGTAFAQILLDERMLVDLLATAPAERRTIESAPAFSQGDITQMLNRSETPGCRTVDLQAMLPAPIQGLETVDEMPELEIHMVDDASNMYDQEA